MGVMERMIAAGQLAPGARGMEPSTVLAQWAGANALEPIEAATEGARYGVRSVVVVQVRWTDCQPQDHESADDVQACESGDHLGPSRQDNDDARTEWHAPLELEEAAEIIRRAGLTFDGADWASDPDGSQVIDYATGEREATTAHLYGWTELEAVEIVAEVNR